MTHLDDASTIPLWISLALAGIATLCFTGVFAYVSRGGKGSMKQAHAAAAIFSGITVVVMNISLILAQGTVERSDGVTAVWGRWAFYIPVWAMFSWAVSNTLSDRNNFVSLTAIATSTFGAGALTIAAISSGNNVYLWFALGGFLWLASWSVYLVAYMRYGKDKRVGAKNTRAISTARVGILLAMLALVYATFYVFFALGHAISAVLGMTGERYAYVGAEFLLWIILTLVVSFESNLIPKRFLGVGAAKMKAGMGRPAASAYPHYK